jgi:hypothetical protein
VRQATQVLAPTAAAGASADATLYTSPALTTTIIRSIFVANTTNGALTFSLAVGGTAATAANCLYGTVTVPANTTVVIFGPIVLAAAGTLHGLASGTGITFSAFGDLSLAGG